MWVTFLDFSGEVLVAVSLVSVSCSRFLGLLLRPSKTRLGVESARVGEQITKSIK